MNLEEKMDAVEAPWGYVCEYLFEMPTHLDALRLTNLLEEYIAIQPATFDDWWNSHHYYGNVHPDFWVSEGREEAWTP